MSPSGKLKENTGGKQPTRTTEENILSPHVVVEASEKRKIQIGEWTPRDIFYAIFIVFVHVLCFFAPSTFSRSSFAAGLISYLMCGVFGVTLSYHRNLAHRSFKLPKYLEYLFAYFALHAYQGDPIFWVSTHRYHHKVTDTIRDPHSPIERFFFAHMGWIFDFNKMVQKGVNYNNVRDLTKQPYYRFRQKTMVLQAYIVAILLYMLGGFPYLVWVMGVKTVWGYHVTFLVNSACHTWGDRAWSTKDLSRNNWWLSLFTFGESWHNNHHAFDYSARHGLEWWQVDLTWYVIKALGFLGLATDIKLPSEGHKQRMSLENETSDYKLNSTEYEVSK
ncbi:hypothetical protein ACHQM5_001057 [Ranunculus cassubicifolius]